ncbi:hypothetical protein [Orrella daihaiensis]|uniref:Uncharacterized protein n=1 Tax=Orrella daihaiensis TaxID=2782176 RepID=A0ABY4AJD1_9BURK|nr:hypothetical protein [Orrella daihaiensis]UOD50382.1 hypothetical protein DHf2319_00040 [Orrella daihaiensis]
MHAGAEIDAKHINVLLSPAQQREFDMEWQRQQTLRKAKKPAALNDYEALHRQAAAVLARCVAAEVNTKTQQRALEKLHSRLWAAITAAQAEVQRVVNEQSSHAHWLDRAVAHRLSEINLDGGTGANELRGITAQLTTQFDLLPVLVTSRSAHRRVSVEERFGWKTKREIRLELLEAQRAQLHDNLLEELEREQHRREVRAARVYLDAYFAADEGTNPHSAANAALQRHGFAREDALRDSGVSARDRRVREMEEQLLKGFESELDAYEREQLEMARELESQQAVGRGRSKQGKNGKNDIKRGKKNGKDRV